MFVHRFLQLTVVRLVNPLYSPSEFLQRKSLEVKFGNFFHENMPKAQKKREATPSSESDSDSGPDDRTPAKRAKEDGGSAGEKDADGNTYFTLDKYKRVTISEFKGKVYVNIREFYEDKADGKLKPGKKGISLTPEVWKKLLSHADDVNAELAKK